MTVFNKQLVSNVIHNGKRYVINNVYMDGDPTSFSIYLTNDKLFFGIRRLTLFSSCKNVVIDWGDGQQETFTFDEDAYGCVYNIMHEYATAGTYEILISNTISKLEISGIDIDTNSESLQKILRIGNNVKKLGDYCFYNTVNLTDIDFSCSELSEFGAYTFYKSGIQTINIPRTVKNIGGRSFAECTNLKYLIIDNNNISSFSENCCNLDYDLKNFDLPAVVLPYHEYIYRYAALLTPNVVQNPYSIDLSIPSGWTSIPVGTFSGIPLLNSCIVPSSVSAILKYAFADGDDAYKINKNGHEIKIIYKTTPNDFIALYKEISKELNYDIPIADLTNINSFFDTFNLLVIYYPIDGIDFDTPANMIDLANSIDYYIRKKNGSDITKANYSPGINGLKTLIFEDGDIHTVFKKFNASMKDIFSCVGDIDDKFTDSSTARQYCYDETVQDALSKIIKPKIDILFLNSDKSYLYWKSICSNKMQDNVTKALVKDTDFFDYPTMSCLYAITYDIHNTGSLDIWNDTETLDIVTYKIEKTDDGTSRNCSEVVLSNIAYTPLPTILTILDPSSEAHELRQIAISNDNLFTAADLYNLQDCITHISFGKYSTLSIGEDALAGCNQLTSVTIPATVTYIGKYAFANLPNLKSVSFKRSRSVFVDEYAFKNTPSLTSFISECDNAQYNDNDFMQLAGDAAINAFESSRLNAKICFADTFEISSSFKNSQVKMLAYPNATNLLETESGIFSGTNNLELLVVPHLSSFNATSVFYGRANSNKALSIDISLRSSSNIPSLNTNFFKTSDDSYLNNFKLIVPHTQYGKWCSSDNWNIYNGSFSIKYCQTTNGVNLIATPTIVNPTEYLFLKYAFQDTVIILNKTRIKNKANVWMLNNSIFDPIYGLLKNVPEDAILLIFQYNAGQIATNINANMSYLMFSDGTTSFVDFNGTLDEDKLDAAIPTGKTLSYIKVNNVNSFDENTFLYRGGLTTVILPSNITDIPAHAFDGCVDLDSIYVGECITTIKEYTFAGCKKLNALYIPNTVTTVDENAFLNYDNEE